MGLDIIAISKARVVKCKGDDDECLNKHLTVDPYPKRRDGLRPGCYVTGNGGRTFGFNAGSYEGYDDWKRQLSRLALGVEPEEVWTHPRRFRGKPFIELIDFPDSVGPVIGPKTSAKLYADFVAYADRAKKTYLRLRVQPPNPARPSKTIPASHTNRAGLAETERLRKALGASPKKQDPNMTWMWEVYRDFRRAFKMASDKGFVLFT